MTVDTNDMNIAREMESVASIYAFDQDVVLKRRFLRLHHYNLYDKHKRLVELDAKLEAYEEYGNSGIHSSLDDMKGMPKMDELLREIDHGLRDFDAASLMYQRSIEAPRVPRSLLYGIKQAASVPEKRREKYFGLYDQGNGWEECALHSTTEKGVLHRVVDSVSVLNSIFIEKSDDPNRFMDRYSEHTVRRCEDFFIGVSFCLAILVPTVLLAYLKSMTAKLIVIICSVLISAGLSSYLTTAFHRTSLAVIAGYTAILVVFLGNSSPS